MDSIVKKLPRCSFPVFWGAISLVYALLFEGIEFAGSPVAGGKGIITLALQWVVVALSAAAVIGLIAVSRRLFAVTFPILTALSAIAAYFKLTLGTSVTPAAVELAIVNELSTWASLITWQLVAACISGFLAGALVAFYRWRFVDAPHRAPLWMAAFALGSVTPIIIVPRFKAPVTARMPYSFWFSVKEYLANRRAVESARETFKTTPAMSRADSLTVVVVIGESLRADHLSLNGYRRVTTPRLEAESTLVSVPRMWTDACYTHLSVPHIMTRADSTDTERAFTEQSFITLFNKAGYCSAWFSNQDAVDSYAYFMHEADTLVQSNAARSLYDYGKWLDSDMLPQIRDFIAGQSAKKLAVVHSIGSHWWYRSHYPDSLARYKPEINSRIVSELSPESIINSYDNTVLATDAFLSNLADMLRDRCAVIIFISDHGESLGEEGRFLHATEAEELHHTACLVWYSPQFASRYPEKVSALIRNGRMPHRTDAIFHTALDAGDIATPVLNPSMSLFKQ